MPSEPTDRERDLTDRLEETIARQAAQEQALFGSLRDGKRVPGLFDGIERLENAVTHVTASVAELTITVATISARVSGEAGLGVEVRDLRRELAAMKADAERKALEAKADADAKHAENIRRADRMQAWGIAFFSAFGLILLGLAGRSIQVMLQGHV